MNKKYPKDTPVTLEMLAEIMKKASFTSIKGVVDSMIEPPKPQPKEGEWWMCRYNAHPVHDIVLVRRDNNWGSKTNENSESVMVYAHDEYVTPLCKMVPEKGAE